MRNATVVIDGTEYANQLTQVLFTPNTPIQQMPVLVPTGTITDIGTSIWSCQLTGIQDNGTGSLGAHLRTNAGVLMEVTFQPRTGSGQDKIEAEVMGMPIPFGGTTGEWRTFDITLPVEGEPTFSQST